MNLDWEGRSRKKGRFKSPGLRTEGGEKRACNKKGKRGRSNIKKICFRRNQERTKKAVGGGQARIFEKKKRSFITDGGDIQCWRRAQFAVWEKKSQRKRDREHDHSSEKKEMVRFSGGGERNYASPGKRGEGDMRRKKSRNTIQY